ncbi:hypothetical protein BX661DRAFT_16822 [Kickxella alabastrina]|uniref:uncharacterized protein n=1 Tax=Kickxella alabastrina TaxID=61397 RepID=UPI00221F0CCC|nr:uncharacterized protein BX661DRAFT_16822 [Kickxella alabastrina]KAI7827760.1 hypothetical protein BX661DRAFT_16822 [Kickxella alabastrina]
MRIRNSRGSSRSSSNYNYIRDHSSVASTGILHSNIGRRAPATTSNTESFNMDDAEVWPTERHHLSFDSPNTGMRRRRVFPNLAPPANPQVAPEESDSDSDQYFDSQALRLPPTPPRRRQAPAPTTDSDSEPEPELPTRPSWISSSPHREHVLGVSTYDFIEDQRLTRQTLERFGELRRQRFLRDQQLRAQLRDQSVLQSTVATNASVLAQLAAMDTNIVTRQRRWTQRFLRGQRRWMQILFRVVRRSGGT